MESLTGERPKLRAGRVRMQAVARRAMKSEMSREDKRLGEDSGGVRSVWMLV